eukprot:251997-Rhodomonas_salina.1
MEFDLRECDQTRRSALLQNLKVGRDVQFCSSLADPQASPRLVVPARLGAFVSRVGFAASSFAEQVLAQGLGGQGCARDGDCVVVERPRKLFEVKAARVARVNLVDLAGAPPPAPGSAKLFVFAMAVRSLVLMWCGCRE